MESHHRQSHTNYKHCVCMKRKIQLIRLMKILRTYATITMSHHLSRALLIFLYSDGRYPPTAFTSLDNHAVWAFVT